MPRAPRRSERAANGCARDGAANLQHQHRPRDQRGVRNARAGSLMGRGVVSKKEGAHWPGAGAVEFAKPVLFLTKSVIIHHGKTCFSIDRTGCSPAFSSACPVSKLAGTAVSFRRSGTAHLEGHFSDYEFSTKTAIAVLTTALEAHQRARECREAILREGM